MLSSETAQEQDATGQPSRSEAHEGEVR